MWFGRDWGMDSDSNSIGFEEVTPAVSCGAESAARDQEILDALSLVESWRVDDVDHVRLLAPQVVILERVED